MSTSKKGKTPQAILEVWIERDLTEEAEAGRLLPAFEAEDVIEQVLDVLDSGRCPVLAGEPGVGKTAVIGEVVRRCVGGRGPEPFEGKRVLQLSIQRRAAALRTGNQVGPAFEELIGALVALRDEVVPFFRDLHLAYDFGLSPLLQALAYRFQGPVLAEGHPGRLRALFEDAAELDEGYVLLPVVEPTLDRARSILSSWATEFQARTDMRFEPDALEQALQLSHRFLARSRLPRKALDLLGQSASLAGDHPVSGADVLDRFCKHHSVPRSLVDPDAPLDLGEVETSFRSRVLGQAEAVHAVTSMLSLIKAGLSDARRPFGAFLFVGPTGVGKTHLAQLLCEFLFGSRDRMVRINMADFQDEMAPYLLFGNPSAYDGASQRGMLTKRLSGHPFAVLLLDELEKASPLVHDRFLQMLDEGSFINGAGETVSCRSTIIIATSNVGAELWRGHGLGFRGRSDAGAMRGELERRLERAFRFEFLNRFDQVVHFRPLTREHVRTIALRELEALELRFGLAHRKLSIEADEALLDWLVAHGHDPDYGARFLRRAMERNVATALADLIVRESPPAGSLLLLSIRGGRVAARLLKRAPDETGGRAAVSIPVGTDVRERSLDAAGLEKEARSLLAGVARRFDELAELRAERADLLERLNESSAWDRSGEGRALLGRYRDLEVAVRVAERCESPLRRLEDRLTRLPQQPLARPEHRERFAALLVEAAAAFRDWELRLAAGGASAVWVVLSSASPMRATGAWLELATMELAWCRRLRLEAAVVATETVDDELNRVVLEVEGPGAAGLLAAEEGLHRLVRAERKGRKARVDVIPKGEPPAARWADLRRVKRREGSLGLAETTRGRLILAGRGLSVDFAAADGETLSHLLSDLSASWAEAPLKEPPLARTYGDGGDLARDPRTSVVVPRLKDVLQKGRLDAFLEGWRRRAGDLSDADEAAEQPAL